ncbi:myosin light chain kinase family member 4 [Ctenodactylus gundi]
MLKVKRLEEINTCYNSNQLEKMAFFQCMEEVEKVKCYLEEHSNEVDSKTGKIEGPCHSKHYGDRQVHMKKNHRMLSGLSDIWSILVDDKFLQTTFMVFAIRLALHIMARTSADLTNHEPKMGFCGVSVMNRTLKPALRQVTPTRCLLAQVINMTACGGESSNPIAFYCPQCEGGFLFTDFQVQVERRSNQVTNVKCVDKCQHVVHAQDTSATLPLLLPAPPSYLLASLLLSPPPHQYTVTSIVAVMTVITVTITFLSTPLLLSPSCHIAPNVISVIVSSVLWAQCVSSTKAISASGIPQNSAVGSCQSADHTESAGSSKRRVDDECPLSEDNKKGRIDVVGTREERTVDRPHEAREAQGSSQGKPQEFTAMNMPGEQDLVAPLDDIPVPSAPFDHRIVTAKQATVNSLYTVSKTEILGGGRFGQVHKCEEKATGLKLAAKIIKTRGAKDKEEVKNEISVMNQLDHVNLIQLYDAFESKNDIILVMEYVEGGELFDRIIDEKYSLTELDTILFIKQICEGIRHMHQMYILHLDLKPENILCVNRDAKQIKIIDFGLARRYKPREKLKVNFGTPEFLAPEVVNYDFVSFPTDMWSVGVIAYMLLSGLSPFLGDNDAETLSNILACQWDLEEEEFQDVSEEAKEFISKLLIKEKSWRISASEALKHPWLSDHKLHARLHAQENCCGCCCFEKTFGKISSSNASTPRMTGSPSRRSP